MHISHAENGVLRVLLSDTDLKRFGTSFAALKEHDPQTNAIIRRILRAVFTQTNPPQESAMTVEAVPVENGCLLLITPRLQVVETVCALSIESENTLLQVNEALQNAQPDGIISVALYRLNGCFYLVFFCERLNIAFRTFLHEFGSVHTGNAFAAHIAEFGTPLFWGNY